MSSIGSTTVAISKDRESAYLAGQKLKDRFCGYAGIDDFLRAIKSQNLRAIKSQKRINSAYHLTLVGCVFDDYSDADCVRCMEECFRYRCFRSAFIKFIMTQAKVALDEPVHPRIQEKRNKKARDFVSNNP